MEYGQGGGGGPKTKVLWTSYIYAPKEHYLHETSNTFALRRRGEKRRKRIERESCDRKSGRKGKTFLASMAAPLSLSWPPLSPLPSLSGATH